jgi:hypothetical protein
MLSRIRPCLSFLVGFALLLTGGLAQAQSVTVLSFTGDAMPAASRALFFNQLRAQIEFQGELQLNDVPEQSFDDLMLSMGCVELDADCAMIVNEVLGSDYLAWGTFAAAEAGPGAVLTLHLYNLTEASEERVRVHPIPEGAEVPSPVIALFGRSLLYDDAGTVVVNSPTPGALVFVEGELAGGAPAEISGRAPGRVLVRVEAPGMAPREEYVSVDLTDSSVSWTLEEASVARVREPRPEGPRSPALRIAGIAMMGAGVAVLGAGIGVGAASAGSQSEFDDLVSQPTFDVAEAQQLQDQGESQALTANVLVASGSAVLVAGAVTFLVDQLARGRESSGEASAPPAAASIRVAPRFSPRQASVDLQIRW